MTQGAFQAKNTTETRGMVPHQPMSEGHSHPSRTIVHAKLEMTEPGDYDEQEADAIAETIAAGGKISRKISGGSGTSGINVSNQMESQLNHLRGGGQAMPTGLRNMMESGFGQDFSHVRLHTDSEAASLSSSIHAKAFTHGNDIYFNQGQFSPNTSEGQKLMAHELTHVVQGNKKIGRQDEADKYEKCMSNARTDNCNYTGDDVCTPLTDMDKGNTNDCSIKYFRDRAKTELLNLKSAYTDAVISIMNDKNKPKVPTDIFFHIAEDILGTIPVVGDYIAKIPKYIDDMLKSVEYNEDINHFNAFDDVTDMYTDLFEEIKDEIYSSNNEDELREIAILLTQENCKRNRTYYKQLIRDRIKKYNQLVNSLGPNLQINPFYDDAFHSFSSRNILGKINDKYYIIEESISTIFIHSETYYGILAEFPVKDKTGKWIVEQVTNKSNLVNNLRFTYKPTNDSNKLVSMMTPFKGDYNSNLEVVEEDMLLNENQANKLSNYQTRRYSDYDKSCKTEKETREYYYKMGITMIPEGTTYCNNIPSKNAEIVTDFDLRRYSKDYSLNDKQKNRLKKILETMRFNVND